MTDADISTDRETKAAVDALVHRLRNRGDSDDEWFAQEFIAALKLRGWRMTPATPSPAWDRKFGGGANPGDEYRAARAVIDAKPPLPEHRAAGGES
jgi:hypothetical protein